MFHEILIQLIQFLSTFFTLLVARYLMELSSIEQDMRTLERFLYGMYRQWRMGTIEHLMVWYRARKLLDYE